MSKNVKPICFERIKCRIQPSEEVQAWWDGNTETALYNSGSRRLQREKPPDGRFCGPSSTYCNSQTRLARDPGYELYYQLMYKHNALTPLWLRIPITTLIGSHSPKHWKVIACQNFMGTQASSSVHRLSPWFPCLSYINKSVRPTSGTARYLFLFYGKLCM